MSLNTACLALVSDHSALHNCSVLPCDIVKKRAKRRQEPLRPKKDAALNIHCSRKLAFSAFFIIC